LHGDIQADHTPWVDDCSHLLGFSALFPARYHRGVLDAILFVFAGINAVVLSRLAAIYWQIG
jgi:hypothetical protein